MILSYIKFKILEWLGWDAESLYQNVDYDLIKKVIKHIRFSESHDDVSDAYNRCAVRQLVEAVGLPLNKGFLLKETPGQQKPLFRRDYIQNLNLKTKI